MSGPRQTLEQAINSIPVATDLPLPLPTVHLSVARWFSSIVDVGVLEPRMCSIFAEDLLYLFYGGLFYRTTNSLTQDSSELPVAFLFDPAMLTSISRYYPFDTGAMAGGRFGAWSRPLVEFRDQFQMPGRGDYTAPCKIVHHVFGTNNRYLRGLVSDDCGGLPEPFPELYRLISADLTAAGVDHRQRTIECHLNSPLSLEQHLLWVAFPEFLTSDFARLYQRLKPSMPRYYAYESHISFNPTEVAAQLQLKAREEVQRFIKLPGA